MARRPRAQPRRLAGLHRAVEAAPPAERAVAVRTYVAAADLETTDAAVTAEVTRSLRATGGDVSRADRAGTFAERDVDPGDVRDLTVIGAYERIEQHAALSDGRWAEAGQDPIEATISEGAGYGVARRAF